MTGSDGELAGGPLHAALARELGRLVADFTGRGATKSRAFVHQDLVVCLLEDGATKAERSLAAAGREELVRMQRDVLHRAMEKHVVQCVERLTKRTVRSRLTGISTDGASTAEVFVLEPMTLAS